MKKIEVEDEKKLSHPHFHTNMPYLYVKKVTKKLLPSPCSTSAEIHMSKNKQKNYFCYRRFIEFFLKYMTRKNNFPHPRKKNFEAT